MITLDQLQVFLTIVDAGSFTKAAKQLRRAQSAVSYAMANLEEQLGVKLFDRSGRRPQLTEAGHLLLADARSVSYRVDGMMERAEWLAGTDEARVAMGVGVMYPMARLVEHLRAFRERFPMVALELHSCALGGVVELAVEGRCDLAIGHVFGRLPADLRVNPAPTIYSRLYVGPQHRLAQQNRWTINDVIDETQVVLSDPTNFTGDVQHGVFSHNIWRTTDLHTKKALIASGFGFGTLPIHFARDDHDAGRLHTFELAGVPVTIALNMVALVHRSRTLRTAGRWLLDALLAHP